MTANNSSSISQSRYSGSQSVALYKIGYGQVVSSRATNQADINGLYVIPSNNSTSTFGSIRNTIGQPRTVEMSLHLLF